MAQTTVSIRMDDQLKAQMEWLCGEFGMNISTAVIMFAKALVREQRLPFEVALKEDPFYSESNMRHLRQVIADMDDQNCPKIEKTMEEIEAMAYEA